MKLRRSVRNEQSSKPDVKLLVDMEGVGNIDVETCRFDIKSYSKLSFRHGDEYGVTMFRPVNEFLSTISTHDQLILGDMYSKSYQIICSTTIPFSITQSTIDISRIINDAFQATGLSKKIEAFVRKADIVMPTFEDIGNQPHHTSSKTFLKEDYIQILTIVVISKMLCPIFGQIIDSTASYIDNHLKEIHCIKIMKDLFSTDFEYISSKLSTYLDSNCEAWVSRANQYGNISLTNACNGFTPEKFGLYAYASILVKKFVNVDIYDISGDIGIYVFSCAKNTVDNHIKTIKRKNHVLPRILPGDGDNTDGNDSILEASSDRSIKTADTPVLIEIAVDDAIRSMISEYDLDKKDFKDMVMYYKDNIIPITDLNKYVLCTFAGHAIGGAAGIDYLYVDKYTELIAITQLYLIKLEYYMIAHAMSMVPVTPKTEFTIIDRQVEATMGASYAYKNLKAMFPYKVGNMGWDTMAGSIMHNIISTVHEYNSAPTIWRSMGLEVANHSQFVYDGTILKDFFEFIYHSLTRQIEKGLV